MHHQLASKSGSGFSWLALLFGAATAVASQACSVDKGKYTFNDGEYNNASNGGGANPNGGGANPNGGGANPNGGGANPNGGDSGAASSDAGAAGDTGMPPTECTVGEHFCALDGHLLTCKADSPPAFDKGIDCGDQTLCSETQGKCLKCAPGTFQCANATLQQCNILGTDFEDAETCDSKAACVANGQKGFCVRCKPSTGFCEGAIIAPSTADDGPQFQTSHLLNCNVDGSGTDTTQVCEADRTACNATTKTCTNCVPGAFVCDGSSLGTCNADGNGYTYKSQCASGALCDAVNGKCIDGPDKCNPGDFKCAGDSLQACDDTGTFVRIDSCNPGMCDANQGRCAACNNSQSTCVNGNVQNCDGYLGQLYTSMSCTGGCATSGTSAYCAVGCVPGTISCYEGSTGYSTCGAGGSQVPGSCTTGQVCNPLAVTNAAQPPCVACTPNQYNCDQNGVLSKCAADGSAYTTIQNCRTTNQTCSTQMGACIPATAGRYACSVTGDLQMQVYDSNHKLVSAPVEQNNHCGSANLCQPYSSPSCRAPNCTVGTTTCQNGDVYTCDTGDQRRQTGMHCATTTRCQDGIGCVKTLAIAAGDAHTCAIVAGADAMDGDSGMVLCWGANESGQLGNASPLLSDSKEARPVLVTQTDKNGGSSTMSQTYLRPFFSGICAGKNFTCADISINQPGVACWGSNANGQLGLNTADPGPYNSPFDGVHDATGAQQEGAYLTNVTCGAEFACALGPNGAAWCWGANDAGQLGTGSVGTPGLAASPIDGHVFTQLTAGARHVCGVQADNTVWCWGAGAQGQLGNGDTKGSATPVMVGMVTAAVDRPLALGNDFTLAIATAKGSPSPYSWGANLFGQLGNGTNGDASSAGPLSGLTTATVGDGGTLYSGSTAEHACARIGDSLQCWGANVFGELGNNSLGDSSNPIQIFDGKTDATKVALGAHSVAVGGRHTCAITVKGDVMCWGANHRYQLGSSVLTPQRIPARAY